MKSITYLVGPKVVGHPNDKKYKDSIICGKTEALRMAAETASNSILQWGVWENETEEIVALAGPNSGCIYRTYAWENSPCNSEYMLAGPDNRKHWDDIKHQFKNENQ